MSRRIATSAAILLASLGAAAAQPMSADPDWPCQQRLVPKLSAGSYWEGADVKTGDYSWRDNPALTKLVEDAVGRDTPDAVVTASLKSYAAKQPRARRKEAVTKLFGYITDEANNERQDAIVKIDSLSRRQQNLSHTVDSITKQADAIPANATGDAAAQRADLVGQEDFNIRAFQEAQHTIRYMCDVPALYDRRLGLIAQVLRAAAGK